MAPVVRHVAGRFLYLPAALLMGVVLLLGLTVWGFFQQPDQGDDYEAIQEGVTTEAEVVARFGPPGHVACMKLSPEMAEQRDLPPLQPDGSLSTMRVGVWWYDDDNSFQLEIDEKGVVFHKYLPGPDGPRSLIRRWVRDIIGGLF